MTKNSNNFFATQNINRIADNNHVMPDEDHGYVPMADRSEMKRPHLTAPGAFFPVDYDATTENSEDAVRKAVHWTTRCLRLAKTQIIELNLLRSKARMSALYRRGFGDRICDGAAEPDGCSMDNLLPRRGDRGR